MFQNCSLKNISLELIYSIFSFLNPQDQLSFGQTCKTYYYAYHNEYINLNPEKHIFYCIFGHRKTISYEFTKIKFPKKGEKRTIIEFDIKYSVCNKYKMFNGKNCEFSHMHKPSRRVLTRDENGNFICRSPVSTRYLMCIKKKDLENLFKSVCTKYKMIDYCQNVLVLDGNCGILMCERGMVPLKPNVVWEFNGSHYTHYHWLCKKCFDVIPKTVSVNLFINNSFPVNCEPIVFKLY